MSGYAQGHVKRNNATQEIALRTIFPEDQGPQLASMAWLVATLNVGARSAKTEEVDSWEDLFVPAESNETQESVGDAQGDGFSE